MSKMRDQIETGFEGLARVFFRHRLKTLFIMLVVVAALASQLPRLRVDTSTEGFLHESDPALVAYNEFRDQFGRGEMIVVGVKAPEVFTFSFLEKLKNLHVELRDNVPYIDDITSLINARDTRGKGDQLIVEDLFEDWPQTAKELSAIKKRAMDNPMFENLLISEDAGFTTILIKTQTYTDQGEIDVMAGFEDGFGETEPSAPEERVYLTEKENSEVVKTVQQIVKDYKSSDFQIHLAGSPVVTHYLKYMMFKDVRKFIILVTLAIALFLGIMFRRVSGVALPLLVVLFSFLSTLGLMAIFGVPIKLPTQILPSFILAVGVGDSVHILAIFFQRLKKGDSKKDAVAYAVGHSGLAILLTSLTTAGGLLSFSSAEIAPIADLGVFASAGVLLALIYTIVLLPALLSLLPVKIKPVQTQTEKAELTDRLLSRIGRFSTSRPLPVIGVTVLIIGISVWGATRVRFSHDVVEWYPEDSDIRVATETIDTEMKGSISLEVVIDTGKVNGLYDPELLDRLDQSQKEVEKMKFGEIFAGKAWTITTILKETNQALHENRKEFYSIPDDRKLIAQEFLLFENSGSDDLEDVTDTQFSKARFTVKVPFKDAVEFSRFIEEINKHFQKYYPNAKINVTGMTALLFQTITNAIKTMAESYLIAFFVITVLMILLIGNVRIGLLSVIPNLFPILLTIGLMGWFQIPMDLFTMLVGSIAIGLAVDDTIHFMHNFRRYYEQSDDPKFAVMETLHTAGRAMLVTTCVLSLGFFIFMFATMNNLFNFGVLTGFTIIVALLADYFIAPALMVVANRHQKTRVSVLKPRKSELENV